MSPVRHAPDERPAAAQEQVRRQGPGGGRCGLVRPIGEHEAASGSRHGRGAVLRDAQIGGDHRLHRMLPTDALVGSQAQRVFGRAAGPGHRHLRRGQVGRGHGLGEDRSGDAIDRLAGDLSPALGRGQRGRTNPEGGEEDGRLAFGGRGGQADLACWGIAGVTGIPGEGDLGQGVRKVPLSASNEVTRPVPVPAVVPRVNRVSGATQDVVATDLSDQ